MSAMKKVHRLHVEGDSDLGEVEGMFSEEGELLGAWCLNDAQYRVEYMNGFLAALGFDVVPAPRALAKKYMKVLKEHFGV